jgi:hypothetical protein
MSCSLSEEIDRPLDFTHATRVAVGSAVFAPWCGPVAAGWIKNRG